MKKNKWHFVLAIAGGLLVGSFSPAYAVNCNNPAYGDLCWWVSDCDGLCNYWGCDTSICDGDLNSIKGCGTCVMVE